MQMRFMHYLKFDMKRTLVLRDKQAAAETLAVHLRVHQRGSSLAPLAGHALDQRELIAVFVIFCRAVYASAASDEMPKS